jgi:hypothetical protein
MSKPTPGKDLTSKLLEAITGNGGSMGVQRLVEHLEWSQADFTWVQDHLINEGIIKRGRGRGGSLQLTDPEAKQAAQTTFALETPPKRRGRPPANKDFPFTTTTTMDDDQEGELEDFDLEAYKSKFKELPADLNAFKPGMKVYRLPRHLYTTEKFAWSNLSRYVVDHVDDGKVFVYQHNVKGAEVMSTRPVHFYVRA